MVHGVLGIPPSLKGVQCGFRGVPGVFQKISGDPRSVPGILRGFLGNNIWGALEGFKELHRFSGMMQRCYSDCRVISILTFFCPQIIIKQLCCRDLSNFDT